MIEYFPFHFPRHQHYSRRSQGKLRNVSVYPPRWISETIVHYFSRCYVLVADVDGDTIAQSRPVPIERSFDPCSGTGEWSPLMLDAAVRTDDGERSRSKGGL